MTSAVYLALYLVLSAGLVAAFVPATPFLHRAPWQQQVTERGLKFGIDGPPTSPLSTSLAPLRFAGLLYSSSSSSDVQGKSREERLKEEMEKCQKMKGGELKRELEARGISTRTFLEKPEYVKALAEAIVDGIEKKSSSSSYSSASPSSSPSPSYSSASSESTSSKSREERLKEEMEKCQKMKGGELKRELEARGISTRTFLEKPEYVKALAEAIVDGIEKKSSSSSGDTGSESYAEYKDVEVLTSDDAGPRPKQTEAETSGGNPFGGGGTGGNPFSGGSGGVPFNMGNAGNIGDIMDALRNGGGNPFGGGGGNPFGGAGGNPFGGGGGNPFGGAGGNPFGGGGGNPFGKAQELMKNPKVREIMAKAQSNPRIRAALNECMSNPAAFAKYQNDPEIAKLVNEMRKYM